jgi:hypothetical protein
MEPALTCSSSVTLWSENSGHGDVSVSARVLRAANRYLKNRLKRSCERETLQIKEALSFSPQYIIAALYFGNDFFDAFALSSHNPEIAALAPPELVRASQTLEKQRALEDEAGVPETSSCPLCSACASGWL